jgi:hypothetical protein
LRTTRFGNGAEKVRKITVTKPDAMAARKKDKEENETLDDLEHNEDGRGCCYQPLLKTYPEAADRSPSSIANVLRDLMRGGQQELRTGIASHFSPGLAALPHFQTMVFFSPLATAARRPGMPSARPEVGWLAAPAVQSLPWAPLTGRAPLEGFLPTA